jgi:hypothetical protein
LPLPMSFRKQFFEFVIHLLCSLSVCWRDKATRLQTSPKPLEKRPPGLKPSIHLSGRFRRLKSPLPRTKLPGFHQPFSRALNRVRKKLVSEQIWDAAAEDSSEKFGTGQLPQGLKPDVCSIVYGPTKVVP